jgi:hypothetical protein
MNNQSKMEKAKKLNAELDSLEKLELVEKKRALRLKAELDSLENLEIEEEKKAAKLMSEIDSLEIEKKKLEEQDGDMEFGDHNEKEIADAKRRRNNWLGF